MQREFVRFVIAGSGCFLLELVILYALTDLLGMYYLFSAGIAFVLSVIVNYILCVSWVFQGSKKRSLMAKIIFVGSSLAGLLINQVSMWFLVEIIGLYYLMAKILATGIVTVCNYVMKRLALTR